MKERKKQIKSVGTIMVISVATARRVRSKQNILVYKLFCINHGIIGNN